MAVQKQKVAILGGGVSSLVTALELTNQPGWRDRYDITVYQMGWRLGGKGASGRNATHHDRIEEHGLHIFFGFYENAFKVMRQVYGELGRHPDAPLSGWQDAFKKQNLIVAQQQFRGQWHRWTLPAPENSGVPGDGDARIDPWHLVQELLQLMTDVFDRWWLQSRKQHVTAALDSWDDVAEQVEAMAVGDVSFLAHSSLLDKLAVALQRQLKLVSKVTEPVASLEMTFLHLALRLAQRIPTDATRHTRLHHESLLGLLRRFRDWLRAELGPTDTLAWETFQVLTLIDLGIAGLTGMVVDDLIVPPVDWQKLDDEDFQAWLMRHGALQSSVESAPIRGLRSAAFASHTTGAAGTSMYLSLRLLLTYQGAILWEMQAGMGDTIFAPLYTVLKRRGVRFEFFQRVDRLELSQPDARGKRRIERVVIGQQATLKQREYEPLVDVKGLPCWPSEPRYDQLVEGEALQAGHVNLEDWWTTWKDPAPSKTLVAGEDFDTVVLGISIGALPYIAAELIEDKHNPRFSLMVDNVKTTLTQAAQLWFTPDLKALGWPTQKPVVVGYAEPFDTWSDMSHLIERESWPERTVGNLAYLCSDLQDEPGFTPPHRSDHQYPHRLRARVLSDLHNFLHDSVNPLWPRATTTQRPQALNYEWLVDPKDRRGIERLNAQFWVADWNPSDRYVLSPAGSTKYRLRPDESGYDNLVLTGDWTLNGFSTGCVEAAVASGMHASRAICGFPKTIIGEWMDALPRRQHHVFDPDAPDSPTTNTSTANATSASARALDALASTLEPGVYVRRDGDLLPLQPFRATGATLNWFVFEASIPQLQALCDGALNFKNSPWQYRPLLPFACFIAATADKIIPIHPDYAQGWMPEQDFAFWIPVAAGRTVGGVFRPERFCFYNPYMFVDSSLAMQGGRDIYGMMKAVASLTFPRSPADPALFNITSDVIPSFPPASEVTPQHLLRIDNSEFARWGDHAVTVKSLEEGLADVEKILADLLKNRASEPMDLELALDMLKLGLQAETRMVSLRQYPDVHSAGRACYQAIVETISKPVSEVKFSFLEPGWNLQTSAFYNPDIASRLGLVGAVNNGVTRCTSLLSFQLRFNFDLDNGSVVYRAV